jgi:hypothetical protein
MPIIKEIKTVKFNDMVFTPIPDVDYRSDYVGWAKKIHEGEFDMTMACRQLILSDLFFIVYFVMGIKAANHPFVVEACREVEKGPKTMTLDVWAREHFKSTIITIAETLQYHLDYKNEGPEKCTAIFAYVRPVAKAFLRAIKILCENSDFLKECFPDVLWRKPETEAPKWSEDDGLIFRRKASARKESTIEAWGLIEGMPTSRHFNRRIYDDIETQDLSENPEQLNKCFSKFEMSDNLGMGVLLDGEIEVERIIGTFYSHAGPIVKIQEKRTIHGELMYQTRIKAATEGGVPNGKSVLLSQERLDKLKVSGHYNSQQLCDPTPVGDRKLDGSLLKDVEPEDIPSYVHKLMLIDPAGDDKDGTGDSWGIAVIGVDPDHDDIGASDIYITDLVLRPLRESEGIEEAVRMYLRNGVILQIGVEKVALSTTEVHIANALKVHHRRISVEEKTLFILRPAGRKKNRRIESALAWPLVNGKIHISTAIPKMYRDKLRQELDDFPFASNDDGADVLSYVYDMIHDKDNKYRLLSSPRKREGNLFYMPGKHREAGGSSWLAH